MHGRSLEILRGGGSQKPFEHFKRKCKYEARMEFPEGCEVQTKKSSVRRVWIFSGTTQMKLITVIFTT